MGSSSAFANRDPPLSLFPSLSLSATQISDYSSDTTLRETIAEKRQQTVPGWDSNSMACYENTDISGSPSEYEKWKHIIDIYDVPKDQKISEWNIYRVPRSLRNMKIDYAYTPQLVSIGPIHHGQENLNPIMQEQKVQYLIMQEQKVQYLKLFWSRRHAEKKIQAMDKFKKYLEEQEEDIRKCYAGNICDNIKKDKMVEMMMLDSVFIMELFLRIQAQKSEEGAYSDDIIVKQSWLNKCIQRDLLLLENQIPFFILEKLYDKFVPNKKHGTFIELARDYFDRFNTFQTVGSPSNRKAAGSSDSNGKPTNKPKHFTDLIRSFYICLDLPHGNKGSPLKTATKLRESGVSFVKVMNDRHLIDIKFEKVPILSWFLCLGCFPKSTYFKARLQIPQLKVDDTTECVLRNLIAFEQCHYPNQPYICNYVSFIDSLIHTKDDVELLVEKEVILHELGSDKEVATLVNSLCKHVVADKTCYINIINKLDKHEKRQWNRTMAALRLVYFRDTWRASSTLVATAVLVFTIFNFCRVVRLVLDLEAGNNRRS